MQLTDLHLVNSIPDILDNYSLYKNSISVAFNKTDFVCSFVHFGDNLYTDSFIDDIKTYLNQNNNGIDINYIIFYSPMLPNESFLELEKQYNNFSYVHLPLIAFGQIPYHINTEQLPELNYKYEKNFCCLTNRSTQSRLDIFKFIQSNNLLDKGFVSYKNVTRLPGDEKFIIPEPYINFTDSHYTKELTDNPRQYVWYYPVENFLFDFAGETFNESQPFLTEKSLKGFFWGKIPVIIGSKNCMHYIEQFGFDIFRDIIDYNYDIQKENDLRRNMYMQQIDKLAKIDINSIKNLEQRLNFNRNLIKQLVQRSQQTLMQINANTQYVASNRHKFLGY